MALYLSPAMFIHEYCWIENKTAGKWIPFRLWDEQFNVIKSMEKGNQVIIMKARQLGLTWLLVCYALHMMLFRSGTGILIFSRREDEASELLERLFEVNARLPEFLRGRITTHNAHELSFGRVDSWARSFPTTKHSGRTYTATMAIIDEADFILWLKRLLNAAKPTIDAGGRLCLLSTVDKENRNSEFKRIWSDAVKGRNNYEPIFLSWSARPDRDQQWYERQVRDYEEDDLWQEYPATPEEALAARKASKRFSPAWLNNSHGDFLGRWTQIQDIPGSSSFLPPQKRHHYLLAADPAEGNPGSDPSAATIFDKESWEQVATIHGTFEPDVFAHYLIRMAEIYKQAEICVERNNHGHTVLLALEYAGWEKIYISPFDNKPGWLSTSKTKVLAVDHAAKTLREAACRINDTATLHELAIFEAATLAAPEGEADDLAIATILALAALRWKSIDLSPSESVSQIVPGVDPLEGLEF